VVQAGAPRPGRCAHRCEVPRLLARRAWPAGLQARLARHLAQLRAQRTPCAPAQHRPAACPIRCRAQRCRRCTADRPSSTHRPLRGHRCLRHRTHCPPTGSIGSSNACSHLRCPARQRDVAQHRHRGSQGAVGRAARALPARDDRCRDAAPGRRGRRLAADPAGVRRGLQAGVARSAAAQQDSAALPAPGQGHTDAAAARANSSAFEASFAAR